MPLPYQWQLRGERLKKMFGGMFGRGERRPQLCPACGALVGISATRCHQCGANLRFGLAAWSKGLSEFFGGHAPVTTSLLIINVIMFGVSLIRSMKSGGGISLFGGMSGVELFRLGENIPLRWGIFQWWRMVTGTFLHGGLLHIGMNMMVLLDIAPVVEEVYGSPRFLFLYVACGMGGSALSTIFGKGPSVGASGAILGLIGVLIAVSSKRGGESMRALRSRLISWVVTIFAFGLLVPGIDNWGHFGGLVIGFVLGKLFADRQPSPGPERSRSYLLGWAAGGVVLAAFVLMFLHFGDAIP
ncbi:MAG TPA: rhomboid family intramembrane serine protease [Candidatus Acidoferrum sp.]